jgi:glucose dehydrogenase
MHHHRLRSEVRSRRIHGSAASLAGSIVAVAAVAALALAGIPTTLAADARQPTTGRDWPTVGGDAGNSRYSPLSRINASNVSRLGGAWLRELDNKTRAAPVVVGGVLFISDATKIYALNAKSGETIWEYVPKGSTPARGGVAVADGKVFCGLADTHVVALDAKSGTLLWTGYIGNAPKEAYDRKGDMAFFREIPRFDPKIGFISSAPTYLNGMVVFGLTGGDGGTRSKIAALDASNGKLAWEWWVVPSPGEPGSETWPDDLDATALGGGAVWMHGAADARLGLVYFGTGNALPILGGEVRPGDNLYMASVVALDVATGKLRWYHQLTHHDLWEMDLATPPILYDFAGPRGRRAAIAIMRTDGYLFVFDRATGEPLVPIEERPVKQDIRLRTAATQPFPVDMEQFGPNCVPNEIVAPGFAPSCFFDTFFYDRQNAVYMIQNVRAAPMAYSPKTRQFYIVGGQAPMTYRRLENPFVLLVTRPPGGREFGLSGALDSQSRRFTWQHRSPWALGLGSGMMATAGDLVFRMEGDGTFMALGAKDGRLLWKFQTGYLSGATVGTNTGGAPSATYEVDGEQYVAVPMGKGLWAFKLGGTLPERAAPPVPPTEIGFDGIVESLGPDDEVAIASVQPTRAPAAVHFVDEASLSPTRVQIPAGQGLRFTNYGAKTHTIVSDDGTWTTGPVKPGESASVTITRPGKYTFYAKEFPWSRGQLIVQ